MSKDEGGPGGQLYEQFARIGKVLGNPKRLEALHILGQGERSVESLATACSLGLTTASAHLQTLRQARLVEARREGVKVYYRLADEAVYRLLLALEEVGKARLAEVQQIVREYFEGRQDLTPVTREELWEKLRSGEVVLLDVRPAEEFWAGHIPQAISVPPGKLEDRLRDLPMEAEFVAYCRGPYCLLAADAIDALRARGLRARRLEEGFPEWRLAGLPVETGGEDEGGWRPR